MIYMHVYNMHNIGPQQWHSWLERSPHMWKVECYDKWISVKEPSLLSGHECWVWAFSGNGDISIWVKNSQVGQKKPKQTQQLKNSFSVKKLICTFVKLIFIFHMHLYFIACYFCFHLFYKVFLVLHVRCCCF